MKRWPLFLLAPTTLGILLAILPLMLGETTLYRGDVFKLHIGLKAATAQTLNAGELPLVERVRSGGEPLLGNANGLPLYPTNLLYLVAPFEWAFNAHFWLHWLLALLAAYWLARGFGLGSGGASATAAFWATGGAYISQLDYYNLVAVEALVPAFVASWLAAAEDRRFWPLSAFLLAFLLLAGDPFSAMLALAIGVLALALRPKAGPFPWLPVLLTMAAAFLLAAPAIVELLRILPTSLRAVANRDLETSLDQGFEWVAIFDLFVPFFLGLPDMNYWGKVYFEGSPAFFLTLSPGLLAIASALMAGRGGAHRRTALWAFLVLAGGFFFALGDRNPLVLLLYQKVPGFSILRFPIKFALPAMMSLSLLGGIGFERFLTEGEARQKAFSRILGSLTALYGCLLLLLLFRIEPVESWLRGLGPTLLAGEAFDREHLRWAGTLFLLTGLGVLLLLCNRLAQRSAILAASLMLALGSAVQLDLMRPLYTGAEMSVLTTRPPALELIPEQALTFHLSRNSVRRVLEMVPSDLITPGNDVLTTRCAISELAPVFGAYWHRRFALVQTADYLDSYLSFFLSWRIEESRDPQAIRVLTALGVDTLLATRELAEETLPQVELLGRFASPCRRELFVYRLREPAAGSYLVLGNIRRVGNLDQGFALLASGDLDPRTTVVLSGRGDVTGRPNGTYTLIAEASDSFELDVDSTAGAVLVARRSWQPFYRAWLDGQPARLTVANLGHVGLELPPGHHRVRVAADRRPTHAAFAVSLLTATLLFFAGWREARRVAAAKKKGEPAGPSP